MMVSTIKASLLFEESRNNIVKVRKVQVIIHIFKLLLENGHISRKDIQNIVTLSDVSFRRYIQELRAYLTNFNEPYEIIYNKSDDIYILKKI